MTTAEFDDFAYPEEAEPTGVIERGMGEEFVAIVANVADEVRRNLEAFRGRRLDCRHACLAWERALRPEGFHVEVVGGEGVDGDVFSPDYRLVPLDQRSGYREGDDVVHRHYWLEIGTQRLIFDPTAHQFDDKGGVSRDRYVVDGLPAIARRF